MKKILPFLCLSLLISCDNEDDKPISQKYFEIEIDHSLITDQSDNWIMLHDQSGALLDAKLFEAGDIISFDTTAQITGDKIAITFLKAQIGNSESYQFESFLCENTNVKWTLKSNSPIVDFGSTTGPLIVKVTDPNNGSAYDSQISNRYTTFTFATVAPANNQTLVFPEVNVTSTIDDFFVFILDKNNIPRYKYLENVVPGELNYSLNDFSAFDKVISVTFPASTTSYMIVKGYEGEVVPSRGYYTNFSLSDIIAPKPRTSFNIGYLNRFNKYSTSILLGYPGYSMEFFSVGSVPSSIDINTSFSASVSDKSFDNYAVSSVDYIWRQSSWFYGGKISGKDISIGWNVIASPEYFKNPGQLPTAILDKYPVIDQNLQYQSTTFYKGDRTFTDVIDGRFKGSPTKDYVLHSKIIYN